MARRRCSLLAFALALALAWLPSSSVAADPPDAPATLDVVVGAEPEGWDRVPSGDGVLLETWRDDARDLTVRIFVLASPDGVAGEALAQTWTDEMTVDPRVRAVGDVTLAARVGERELEVDATRYTFGERGGLLVVLDEQVLASAGAGALIVAVEGPSAAEVAMEEAAVQALARIETN